MPEKETAGSGPGEKEEDGSASSDDGEEADEADETEGETEPEGEAEKARRGQWLKDIDLSRATENVLVGVILFFGRYPVTFLRVLLRPASLEEELIFNPSYKNDAQVRFTRPVTFLVVSGFVYLGFTLATFGTLIPIESIVEHFQWLIDRMPKKIEDLTLGKIAIFMVPFVLLVALYAYIASVVFRAVGANVHFKVHLNVSCYAAGSIAVLINAFTMVEGPAWDVALGHGESVLRALPLLIASAALLFLLGLGIFRYVDLIRRAGGVGWIKAVCASTMSIAAFQAISWALLFLTAPILEKLK